MIQLYGAPGAANLAPHMVLEELGLPYEFVLVDTAKQEHKSAEYLKLNPNGRVPTLSDGEEVFYESAAICLHLCDRQPEAGLVPAFGSNARGQLYKWLTFLTNTLQPALIAYFYPERLSTEPSHAPGIKAQAEITALALYSQLDQHLGEHGPYLLGERFSVADLYLMMLVRWGRWFDTPPVLRFGHISTLVETLSARPAVQRAFAQEQIPAPYCLKPAS